MENSSLPYHCVHQVGVTVKLVLDDVVQHLKQEEHQVVVGLVRQQEPGSGECFHKMNQLAGCCHGHGLQVWRYVAEDGEEAVK